MHAKIIFKYKIINNYCSEYLYKLAYFFPRFKSSSCVPFSANLPDSITKITSEFYIVVNLCATAIEVLPLCNILILS